MKSNIKNFFWQNKVAIGACVLMGIFSLIYWVYSSPGTSTIGENIIISGTGTFNNDGVTTSDALIVRSGGDIKLYNNDNNGSVTLSIDNDGELKIGGNLVTTGTGNSFFAGKVGIGTTDPNNLLEVLDLISFDDTNRRMKLGYQAGKNDKGKYNTWIGQEVAKDNEGNSNLGIGYQALYSNTTGYENVAIGEKTLYSNTTGWANLAVGRGALSANTTGYYNTAIGGSALGKNTTGRYNLAVGAEALIKNTTGEFNTAIGATALRENTTGGVNTAIGAYALRLNTTGGQNTAIGQNALFENKTGVKNLAIGASALYSNQGSGNMAIGTLALFPLSSGDNNLAIGTNAGRWITGGAGHDNKTCNNSIFLGNETKALANGDTNEIVIGAGVTGLGSNTIVIGNENIQKTALRGNVGIGTTDPTAKLDINGDTLRLRNSKTPDSSSASCNKGDIVWDENYIYVCVDNNTWKRAELASW